MKSLEIPEVNAKVTFVWMNVEQQRKMCDEDLAAVVPRCGPNLLPVISASRPMYRLG
jgi:hypothetical protein